MGIDIAPAQCIMELNQYYAGGPTSSNVYMLSKWHVHAAGYARELIAMDDVNVTCIWDEDAERGAAWARNWAWRSSRS